MRFRTTFFLIGFFYREEGNQFICSAAVWDGLELLSAEHLLFTCHTRPHLALASFTKSKSVSAQRTLTLEVIVQYKCRLSVKYLISVYSIILEQWLSKLSPLLSKCLQGIWEGKCVVKCVFLL
jgi:hypothetical protein